MPGTHEAMRQVPLATPFGRLAHERGTLRGVILSAAVHVALVLLVIYGGTRLAVADRMPGTGAGRFGGGGGGGSRALLLFAPPAAQPAANALPLPPQLVVPKAAPIPLPEVQPPDAMPPPISDAQLLASLSGAGPGKGPGAGPGAGTGSGGGTGSGRGPGTGPDSGGGGGNLYPPVPQQIIMPPSERPSSVRGMKVTVLFEVSERGDVMRVSIAPMPPDRGFAREFLDRLKRYRFTPARTLDGRPVAALFPVTITL